MARDFDGRPVRVTSSAAGAIVSGKKAIAAAGTAEALGTGALRHGVWVRALSTNTGAKVYIGDSSIDNTGFGLAKTDQAVFIAVNDLSLIFADVDTNGDSVVFVGS